MVSGLLQGGTQLEIAKRMYADMVESFRKNKKGICLILCSAVLACVGQLLWKISATDGLLYLLMGFIFYGLGAIIMLLAYRYGELSVLQPMLSMNYVLSVILGALVLQEAITFNKAIGLCIITLGVILIGGGSSED